LNEILTTPILGLATVMVYEITFVGHSKGGGAAAGAAIATNMNAIIFNPAPLNANDYGLIVQDYTANMKAFIVKGEIFNSALLPILSPVDEVIYLDAPKREKPYYNHKEGFYIYEYDSLSKHSIKVVKLTLEYNGYN